MGPFERIADRALGVLGLFLIGAISWVADHATAAGRPAPGAPTRAEIARSVGRERSPHPGGRLPVPQRARS